MSGIGRRDLGYLPTFAGEPITCARLPGPANGFVNGFCQRTPLSVLGEAAASSADIEGTLSRLITGTQFQDHVNQHLTHLKEAIEALGEAAEALQEEA